MTLKEMCIRDRLVTKNFKLNPKRNLEQNEVIIMLEKKYGKIPLKVMIDIEFFQGGKKPSCEHCASELNFNDLSNYRPIKYLHKNCVKQKRKETIDWCSAIEKRKATIKETYGENFVFDVNVEKRKHTKLERYGSENFVNPEKAKQTKLERYGSENYRNDEQIKETNLKRYGSENPYGSKSVIKKISNSLYINYGGRGFQSKEILEKIKTTNREKYGFENVMQNHLVSKKSSLSKKLNHYGEDLYTKLNGEIFKTYEKYKSNTKLSINKYAGELGADRRTLARHFIKAGLPILDRDYCYTRFSGEEYLEKMILSLKSDITIIRNDRKILDGKEIDIWLPEYNIGIEYHGSYWHQEEKRGNSHQEKYLLAKEVGIHLIQIFDYELEKNLNKILGIISARLGLFDEKIGARNCNIRKINSKESRLFLEANHLQGFASSKEAYGLFRNEELIQMMSFGKSRYDKNAEWEMIRLCSKIGASVSGGTERLWSKFKKEHNPSSVVSYADCRFFTGKSYSKLGFNFERNTGSNYIWDNGSDQIKRYKTQKKKLIENGENSLLSETDIMKSKGFYKILDAGNAVWIWKNS